MAKIDDPLANIRELANDEGVDFAATALQLGGLFAPVFKVYAIAKGIFDEQLKGNPLKIAILALCDELERLKSHWPSDFESVASFSSTLIILWCWRLCQTNPRDRF